MKAVVMAGGEGSRLRPLTSSRPKPLAPVANKPVMHHIVDLLRRYGITEVVSTLHYLADEIENYFGDGSDFGISMSYVVEDTPLGTAGAVKLAQSLIGNDRFVVISGDALTDIDLGELIGYHDARGATATIALQRVANPLEFGVVVTDERGRITRFLEKPSWGEVFSDTINTGIYVLEPSIFDYMESGKNYDFSRDIFPFILRDGKPLYGHVVEGYWSDIGNLQQYLQANYDALSGAVRVEIPGTEIRPRVWVGENARIAPGAHVHGPACIGRNVTIEPGVVVEELTSIGSSSIVAENAHLHRSITWEDVYVGEHASLTGCTLADRVIVKDRVTVMEGAVVGRGSTLGSGATVPSNIKLWPDKSVAAGSIVSMSLIYGIKWPGSLFAADGVSGLANIEVTPEFALKLGQALGSVLRPGQTVMTSRDAHPASRLTNRCVIAGLLSVGVNVQDLRENPTPVSRYAVSNSGDAGVHTGISPSDPDQFLIEFFDAHGVNIDKATERKIENIFFREDFRRTAMADVGSLSFPERTIETYASGFVSALKPKAISASNMRVVIDYAYGNASLILPRILSNLGIEMIALNAFFDNAKVLKFGQNRQRHLEQLSNVTTSLGASLGILLDQHGEALSLVDDRGRIIEGSRLLALLTVLVASFVPQARIAVPVMAPTAIETVADAYGAAVIRTRTDRRSLMALAAREGAALSFASGANYELIFPEFQPVFDSLYASAKIMELIASAGHSLGEIVDGLPEWHLASRRDHCPWERKGQIMRRLLDETNGENVDLTDGIRVGREGGWVLVIPDASDPLFNVYAEGRSDDEAHRYADEISTRIEELARG
ncbi:MAG: NTP transferase domain-containing protein [Candidatus Eremiobacteraeota bacterium]|nr:NTP transferase domain-containing protein [Candidatus Eremiobacteraeota bacterium]